ncbi:restriction endonuclease subunit S [Mesorhizobium sp. B1-1-9]|uniref:restriction endonuclease subunit S n=1 Tax=Mesorhizobium sp. B1-1-9 TaxID=2589975 RepID=UPI00112AD0F8|nr:restriction endonuclease subunit S [Mesorhizobium sp. B1-1-9]TPN49493.1 restriction endonuclease subunit S [Mesorhizobium sp. B1-1-9]
MSVVALPFERVLEDVSSGNLKVQKGDYAAVGRHPIVDQGQEFVGGYTDDPAYLVKGTGPWIIFGDHTRALKFVDFPFCMGADGVKVLKPNPDIEADLRFLYHFLSANEIPSAGYSRHYKFLKRLEIRLPSLPEQRRIAAVLDKAESLRGKRKRAIQLLEGLTQSMFLEMFGDPSRNPKGFERGVIGDLLSDTQYGTSEKAGGSGAFPILRMGNITADGRIDTGDLKFIDLLDGDIEKYTVRRGDLLFNRTNSPELVGKTAVFDRDQQFAFAGYLVRARTKPEFNPYYVAGYLNSRHGKATLKGMAKSIVGMANINAKEMASIPILIPNTESQDRYDAALASIIGQRAAFEEQMQVADSLFSALQHRAFSGAQR